MSIQEQYRNVRSELDSVCRACGRDPQEVLLVAVSKTVDVPEVEEALAASCRDFGENRPDELMRKYAALPQAHWHFIGNVQSRRIHDIVPRAQLIHSVFKPDHLPKINAAAQAAGKVQNILLEVNSGEETKGGILPGQALDFIKEAQEYSHIHVCGLMTMAPQGSPEKAREAFVSLRLLRNELEASCGLPKGALYHLSMGMSEDWPLAVSEGATIIRVGRAVFSGQFRIQ